MSVYIECPFCHEGEFDFIGLKGHLSNNWCEVYNATLTPMEETMRRRQQDASTQPQAKE